MNEQDMHYLLEEQDKEGKALLWEKVRQKTKLAVVPGKQPAQERKKVWDGRLAKLVVAIAACVCVACVAVLLPFLLKEDDGPRYTHTGNYVVSDVKTTVKEYADSVGKALLYVDWYAQADEIATQVYVRADNGDFGYIAETMRHRATGETVTLYVAAEGTETDAFVLFAKYCNKECVIQNVTVRYFDGEQGSKAVFGFEGYRYYVELQNPQNGASVTAIVENMLLSYGNPIG